MSESVRGSYTAARFSDDLRLFIRAITEHVNAINALLDTGAYL